MAGVLQGGNEGAQGVTRRITMPVRVFPVRHHSPSASRALAELIAKDPPKAILIEAPSDAESLIPVIVDEETEPPVAILAYVPGGEPHSALYPFVAYSPEYTALVEGTRRGIRLGFFDVPSGIALAQDLAQHERIEGASHDEPTTATPVSRDVSLFDLIPEATGHESFDEFWEASFEMPATAPEDYVRLSLEFGRLVRSLQADALKDPEHRDRVRERHMRDRLRSLLAEGVKEDEILLVTGAFHSPAFIADDFLEGSAGPVPLATELTVIPYSYGRMSEQLGYGAGNRAPLFYQEVHDRHGDFRRTSLEALIGIAEQLRLRGHSASLSDVIDAYRLCNILARMREKVGPGLEEIRDATIACMLQGRSIVLDDVWRGRIIGNAIGKVSSIVGKTSLQEEFRREVGARRIPATDDKSDFWLHLTSDTGIGTSIFLHRLRASKIPFAVLESDASRAALLSRVREKWGTQWTPSTEIALVENIVFGQTIAQVCEAKLRKVLEAARSVALASGALLDIAVCDLSHLYDDAVAKVEHVSSEGDDLHDLAVACQNVSALLSYGTSRRLDAAQLRDLLMRLFHRASSSIPRIGKTDEPGADRACTALKILHEVSTTHAKGDRMFLDALVWATDAASLHPRVSGLATSLLYLAKEFTVSELEGHVLLRVGGGALPMDSAQYLAGLLSINRATLVKNRAIVTFLDRLITALPFDSFRDIVPIFRRTFGDLSRSEIGYLLEHVFDLHGVADRRAGAGVASERDIESLRAADSEVKQLTDQWDDLFKE